MEKRANLLRDIKQWQTNSVNKTDTATENLSYTTAKAPVKTEPSLEKLEKTIYINKNNTHNTDSSVFAGHKWLQNRK
jgi:hypothetical protein